MNWAERVLISLEFSSSFFSFIPEGIERKKRGREYERPVVKFFSPLGT